MTRVFFLDDGLQALLSCTANGGLVRKVSLLLLSGVLVITTKLRSEEIQLKDGSKITGTVVAVKDEKFQVRTNYGEISVPRSDIISITFPDNAPKKTADGIEEVPAVDETLQNNIYTNRTAGFQITVPSGWKIAPALRKSKDVVAALDSADETLFFMVTPEKFSGTLATYKVLAETQYQKNFTDYVIDGETEAELDGHKGSRTVWHGTSNANQAKLKFLVYIVPYDGRMVRLSFFTLTPLFNDAVPIFEKIAQAYHSTH